MASRVEKNKKFLIKVLPKISDRTQKPPTKQELLELIHILANENPYLEDYGNRPVRIMLDSADEPLGGETLAGYRYADNTVLINEKYLENISHRREMFSSAAEVVITILHEACHARQHQTTKKGHMSPAMEKSTYTQHVINASMWNYKQKDSKICVAKIMKYFAPHFEHIKEDEKKEFVDQIVDDYYFANFLEEEARTSSTTAAKLLFNRMMEDMPEGYHKETIKSNIKYVDSREKTDKALLKDSQNRIAEFCNFSADEIVEAAKKAQIEFDVADVGGDKKTALYIKVAFKMILTTYDEKKLLSIYKQSLDNPREEQVMVDGKTTTVKHPNVLLNSLLSEIITRKIAETPNYKKEEEKKDLINFVMDCENLEYKDVKTFMSEEEFEDARKKKTGKRTAGQTKSKINKNAEVKIVPETPIVPTADESKFEM